MFKTAEDVDRAPRKHHVEQIFGFLLLLEVVGGPCFDQSLEVVRVLLHTRQQVVQQVSTAVAVSAHGKVATAI